MSDIKEVYGELLSMAGFCFKNGRLFDEDKQAFLLYKKKYIVEDESYIMRDNSIVMDLLKNKKLSQYMFQVYIDKETNEGNLYLSTFAVVNEKRVKDKTIPVKKKLLMLVGNGNEVSTHYYYNECLTYIEAIFLASGMHPLQIPDLSEYDSIEEVIKK